MPKLTERRQLQTRNEIADAAIALFKRVGFDESTMADVAEAADVSRRTVYRHFPTKEDLVFEFPRLWLEMFRSEMDSREEGERLEPLFRRGILTVAAAAQAEEARVLDAFSVVQATESLRGTHVRTDDQWVEFCVEMMLAEPGADPDLFLEILIAARSMIVATNSAIIVWALGHPNVDIVAETNRALDQVKPLWPALYVD